LASSATSARLSQAGVETSAKLSRVAVDRLVPDPNNVRGELVPAEIEELAASMAVSGLIQPIRARWKASQSQWVVVSGHKRLAAAKVLGWQQIDVILYPAGATDEEVVRDQLVENLVRSDPDKLSQARRMDELRAMTGCTMEELGARLGLHKGPISRYLALLKPETPPASAGTVRRARGAGRAVRWSHRPGRGRVVRVEGRPGDDVVQLLEAALADARKGRQSAAA